MRRKIALQVLVSNLNIAIYFVLTLILARLLRPEDIGVFSMSAVLIAVASVFRDFGVTAYVKRVKVLDDDVIRTARTLLIIASSAVALIMYATADMWATFFDEPRVAEVVKVLAYGFVLIPFGAVSSAVLSRELQVTRSATVSLLSACVYFGVSIAFALNGLDHMTMAWANFASIIFTGIALNLALDRKLPWKPSLKNWREVLSFGTGNLLGNLAIELNKAIPDMALGRLSNAAAVGLFSRANSTVSMMEKLLQPPINYFTLPYMAKVHHSAGDVGAVYARVASILQCLTFPALAWIAIMSHDIILTLYGAQWVQAASAVPWLCVAIGIASWFSLATPTLNGVGKPYAVLWPLLCVVLGKLGGIALFYDGTLAGFALAMASGEVVGLPVYLWILKRHASLDVKVLATLTGKALVVLVPANLALLGIALVLPAEWSPAMRLVTTMLLSGLMHAGIYLTVKLPIQEEVLILIKNLRHRHPSQNP